QLYRMDSATFTLEPIDVVGGDFAGGNALFSTDGLLLEGKTLYASQFSLNLVAVVGPSPDYSSGILPPHNPEPFPSHPATETHATSRSRSRPTRQRNYRQH